MPRLSSIVEQYRHEIGNYTYKQDEKYGDWRQQNTYIKALSNSPGLHSGNRSRQNTAHAMVQLISMLNAVSNSTTITEIDFKKAEKTAVAPYRTEVSTTGSMLFTKMINPRDSVFQSTTDTINTHHISSLKNTKVPTKRHAKHPRKMSLSNMRKTNKKLIGYLRKEGLLPYVKESRTVCKEELVAGVSHWLFDSDITRNIIPLHKMEAVAKKILGASGDYGSQDREILSRDQVEMVIRNWMFNEILGMPISEYLTRKMAASDNPAHLTVSNLKNLVALNVLDYEKLLSLENIPFEWRSDFEAMWSTFLQKELPLFFFTDKKTNDTLLNSNEFSQLFTGTRFLSDIGQLHHFSREESMLLGDALWRMALREGVSADKTPYFLLPALFFVAGQKTKIFNEEKKFNDISADVIYSYVENKKISEKMQQRLMLNLESYNKAVTNWLSKKKLADKIIANCPVWELHSLHDMAGSIRPLNEKRERAKGQSQQLYMNGVVKPCRTAPDSLGDEYKKLTKNVADSFREIDKYFIDLALHEMDDNEKDFVFSSRAIIHPVSFSMKTNNGMIVAYNFSHDYNLKIALKKTDLFSAVIGNEERIYALKLDEIDGVSRYSIIRVDRNILNYIDSGILDYDNFGKNGVTFRQKYTTDKNVFHFTIFTDKNNPITSNGDKDEIIDAMSAIHHNYVYQSLYDSGNDDSQLQTLWKVLKYVMPFYDCIEGVINNNPVQAIPSCLMDAAAITPVFSQALRMGSKFGMGLGKGGYKVRNLLRTGEKTGIAHVFLQETSVPTLHEITSLSKNTLRSLDPGFELVSGIGRGFTTRLFAFLNKDKKTIPLAEKLVAEGVLERLPMPSSSAISARLPYSEVSVPLEKISQVNHNNVYALVNPDTGAVAGKRFYLNQDNTIVQIQKQNQNRVLQPLRLNAFIPEIENSYILYNNPRRPPGSPVYNVNHQFFLLNDPLDIELLADFLPPRLDISVGGRINIDLGFYRQHALEIYFPNQWRDIIVQNAQAEYVFIHSVSNGLDSIPEEFYFLRENLWAFTEVVNDAKDIANYVKERVYDAYFSNDESIPDVDRSMDIISDYMESVLTIDSPEIIGIAVERLKFYLEKVCEYFENNYGNIYLATAKRTGIPYNEYLGTKGFTHYMDANKRIVILVDRFTNSEALNNAMHLTVLHEISHISGGTRDFFSSPYMNGIGEPEDIPEALEEQLTGREQTNILHFDNDFLEAYAQRMGIQRPSVEQFKLRVLNDDMLRANIIMDNADSLVHIINDLYDRLFQHRRLRDTESMTKHAKIAKDMMMKAVLSLAISESENPKKT